ncbi:hypothetical protein NQ314_015982 [Rhamnusium bicolor]|uniref:DNA ligase IV n=1 Tax=Rhamnusium bicolor TaxID=1586634 RepID=A0AAV8WXI8_9CUCU|nr:hypothetical protein NQ314_015982 [Rhamnusium bicolor]
MECWEKLAWEYNSMQTSGLRTGIKLKSAYEQMKKQAKQHKSQDKVRPTRNKLCDSNNNLPKLPTPSTSADPDDTVSGFENILIVYENSDHQNKINEIAQDFQEQPVPKKRKICTQIQELLPADTENENIEPKKTGVQQKTKKGAQWKTNVSINNKRFEILKQKLSQATDFGDVVYSVIRKYLSNHKTTLTIEELNSYLDNLTKRSSESEAEDILLRMFKKSSPENIRWIIRIILKDLKLGISSNRLFTPKLNGIFNEDISRIILDGEMMLWDKRRKKFGSKGMTLDVKKLNAQGPYQPCFCVYDIILLNDNILTNRPLKERVAILRNIFKCLKPGTITLSEIREVTSRQEIIDELNLAVNKEEEGIIVKEPNSIYKYSDRNSGWYKMKLEYFEDAMNDLDLILMGGQYASSTSDKLNSFVVGIRSGMAENGKPLYLALGKVSTGLTDEQLETLNKKVPDYYIEPEFSLVFKTRATELIRTTDNSFKTPYTLRFPRVLMVRDDKPVDECLNINELLEHTKSNKSVIKLNKRNIELDEILKTKVKRIKQRQILMPTILDNTKVLDLLEGYTIFVLNGGTISYRINDKVDIVLVGIHVPKVKEIVSKRNKFDVINTNWLHRVIQDGNLLGYEQDEVYSLGYNYKNCLWDELDMYGDSYTTATSVEKLKRTFSIISEINDFSNQNNTVALKKCTKNFEHFIAYFDKYVVFNDPSSENIYESFVDELEFSYYNGTVNDNLTEQVNTIFYNGDDEKRRVIEGYLTSINRSDIQILPRMFIYE